MRTLAGVCAGTVVLVGLSFLWPSAAPAASSRHLDARGSQITIVLREGQTLWSIARAHGVSVEAIARANGLKNPERVRAGQRLIIPVSRTASHRYQMMAPSAPRVGTLRISAGFMWPARGVLTSRFGWRRYRHHDGIDIAARPGTPIFAAKAGTVIFSGWYFGYGRTVLIDHGRGVTTRYAHASALLVRTGQEVRQGQVIARVGCTGHCTGPHLHFEVLVNGRAVNPLPALASAALPTLTVDAPVKSPQVASKGTPPGRGGEHPGAQAAANAPGEQLVSRIVTVTDQNGNLVRRDEETFGHGQIIRRESIVVSGDTVTTVRETLRDGRVVDRTEEVTIRDAGRVVRITRIFQLRDGVLILVEEIRTVEENPAPADGVGGIN